MLLIVIVSLLCQVFGEPRPIVKGYTTDIAFHPWVASIQFNCHRYCAGSIISDSVILTAGHCITEGPLDKLVVRVGSTRTDSGGSLHNVVFMKRHENYTEISRIFVNDLGLVKVSPRIALSTSHRNVAKIQLAEKWDEVISGTGASVAGWGVQTPGGKGISSPEIKKTFLRIVDTHECSKSWGDRSGTWMGLYNQICATGVEVGGDICRGDSGSPLVVNNIQVGISVWGSCADPRFPASVYTDVARFRDWIDENVALMIMM